MALVRSRRGRAIAPYGRSKLPHNDNAVPTHPHHLPPERGASPRAIYAHLGLDGVSEGIAVGVLAHEARVDDVRGLCGKSRDAARRADRCSPDVGVIALAHARRHPRRSAVSIDLPGRRASAPHRREGDRDPAAVHTLGGPGWFPRADVSASGQVSTSSCGPLSAPFWRSARRGRCSAG